MTAADEAAKRLALQSLVEACICAAFTAKNLNYPDFAYVAAQRAEETAGLLGDPVYMGKASFAWLMTLTRAGSWERNLAAAERAAGQLEPHARDPLGLAVLGMITLTASLAAASIQRNDTAHHWLGEAAALAARVRRCVRAIPAALGRLPVLGPRLGCRRRLGAACARDPWRTCGPPVSALPCATQARDPVPGEHLSRTRPEFWYHGVSWANASGR